MAGPNDNNNTSGGGSGANGKGASSSDVTTVNPNNGQSKKVSHDYVQPGKPNGAVKKKDAAGVSGGGTKVDITNETYQWLKNQYNALQTLKQSLQHYRNYYNDSNNNFTGSVFIGNNTSVENRSNGRHIFSNFQACHVLSAEQAMQIIDHMEALLASYSDYCAKAQGVDNQTSSALSSLNNVISTKTPIHYTTRK